MKTLKTIRLKPNPSGKDRTRHGGATATQLGAEWVDIENMGHAAVDVGDVELYHVAYSRTHPNGQWERVTPFSGSLPAGKVMRVHSGSGPVSALRSEDLNGADYHLFTNRDNYVWNNAEGDCSGLFLKGQSEPFDKACYAKNPPEGVVLKRVNDALVPAASAALAGSYR